MIAKDTGTRMYFSTPVGHTANLINGSVNTNRFATIYNIKAPLYDRAQPHNVDADETRLREIW